MSKELQQEVIDICRQHGIAILSDEVYRLLEHDPSETRQVGVHLSPVPIDFNCTLILSLHQNSSHGQCLRKWYILCHHEQTLGWMWNKYRLACM